MSIVSNVQTKKRIPFLQLAKTIIATLLAWFVALLVYPDEQPIFAAIAAIIVVQPSINQSLGKALERSTGVVLGVAVALGASLIFGSHSWLVLVAVIAAFIAGWLFKFTPGTSNQIAISAMLVIAIGSATPEYALGRIVETIIGATIAFIVNAVIVPPVALEPSQKAVSELGANIAEVLEDIGSVLRRSTSYEVLSNINTRARELRNQLNVAQATIQTAQESLRFNVIKGKHEKELDAEQQLLSQLAVLVTRTIGVARAVRDNYDESVIAEPGIAQIAEEFMRSAHDLRMLVRDAGLPAHNQSHPATNELPALTEPIRLTPPSGANWILIGFLMENLRRIRDEIISVSD
ncbi:hypothetical protein AINA4_07130 [Aurantimicrobium sp. INA4]|uniref:FUSC family protein n=1 Tax=Aurantimicrobium sp. INA4 TaxID=2986279 RepID=UPI0024917093|nr:FUSC family protein [Aurantimicrobium sp. INA4]BDU10792.1 hypothetical protein AINA4_07130 [Aurantimicrobium sp. INA4]